MNSAGCRDGTEWSGRREFELNMAFYVTSHRVRCYWLEHLFGERNKKKSIIDSCDNNKWTSASNRNVRNREIEFTHFTVRAVLSNWRFHSISVCTFISINGFSWHVENFILVEVAAGASYQQIKTIICILMCCASAKNSIFLLQVS